MTMNIYNIILIYNCLPLESATDMYSNSIIEHALAAVAKTQFCVIRTEWGSIIRVEENFGIIRQYITSRAPLGVFAVKSWSHVRQYSGSQ